MSRRAVNGQGALTVGRHDPDATCDRMHVLERAFRQAPFVDETNQVRHVAVRSGADPTEALAVYGEWTRLQLSKAVSHVVTVSGRLRQPSGCPRTGTALDAVGARSARALHR